MFCVLLCVTNNLYVSFDHVDFELCSVLQIIEYLSNGHVDFKFHSV